MPLQKDKVPINGLRLRVALDDCGLGFRAAGRAIGERWWGPQASNSAGESIRAIASGKSNFCAAELREALAMLLRVPETWLAGESALPNPLRRSEPVDPDQPLRQELTQYRINQAFDDALYRDFPVDPSDRDPHLAVKALLPALCRPGWWREQLLANWSRVDQVEAWLRAAGEMSADATAQDHLFQAFRYILDPWTAGKPLRTDSPVMMALMTAAGGPLSPAVRARSGRHGRRRQRK